MPYGEFPFPNVPEGAIWIPDLVWQSATTIVYDSFAEQDTPRLPKMALSYKDYKEQNRLKEVIPVYDAAARMSPWGNEELNIGMAFHYGHGGLEKDVKKALEWYKRGAEEKPIIYYLMGQIHLNSDDPTLKNDRLAAHYFSKGAARGCARCASRILYLDGNREKYPSLNLPQDTTLRYYVYLNDLGYAYADIWLHDYLKDDKAPAFVTAFNQDVFGEDEPAHLETGEFASILHGRFRTGLVPAGCIRVQNEIDASETMRAGDKLANKYFGCFGRFRGQAISNMFAKDAEKPKPTLTGSLPYYFGEEAVKAGEMSYALLSAMTHAGYETVTGYETLKRLRKTKSTDMAKQILTPAVELGYVDARDANALIGELVADEAKACWAKANGVGNFMKRDKRENVDKVLTQAAVLGCDAIEAKAIVISGNSDVMGQGTYVQDLQAKRSRYRAEDAAERERERVRNAQNRASYRSPPTTATGNSYIASGSSGSARQTVSSADAYAASKKSVCSSSITKTSFCR